ncbi:MAG: sigma-70 family RNA polymerase sigma factor [Planctomycetes bacterium]|nr:sigma-70 family RNA polymerase sigma factor [Planctomycetota bacterium]
MTYGGRVLGLLRRVLGQEEDALDAYQETWFSLWRASLRLRWTREPWPFIRKTALRKAIDRMRRQGRSPVSGAALDIDPPAPIPGEADFEIDLSELGREERACLVLFFWENCSVQEIATTLQVPTGTVKTWMFRARNKLRRRITKELAAHDDLPRLLAEIEA